MRRGDITTPILLWFTTIAAVLILVVWYANSSDLLRIGTESIDEDLTNTHYAMSLACSNEGYTERIIPHTMGGSISFNQTAICIIMVGATTNITRCVPQPCRIDAETIFLLSKNGFIINKSSSGINIMEDS